MNKIIVSSNSSKIKFPTKPTPFLKREAGLFWLVNRLKNQRKSLGLSNLNPPVSNFVIGVWKKLLSYNPNNLGNWSIVNIKPSHETAAIEREVVLEMIDLYRAKQNEIEGYLTSGATEANIFSSWLGVKYLERKKIKGDAICLLKTSLTHYSLSKAADIIRVPTFLVSLNRSSWGMDNASLVTEIKKLAKRGYKGFLLPLTLGYSLTGTKDPYEDICLVIRNLEKKTGLKFFLWIDAAFNGLVEPFLNEKFAPLNLSEIQTLITDFHKFGYVPISAGVVLYRKGLRRLIEKPVDYLDQKDNTLLSSRSGVVAVGCWEMIHSLGKSGFQSLILKSQKEMQRFINKYKKRDDIEFITSPNSLNCGIMLKHKDSDILNLAKKYGLDFKEIEIKFVGGKEKLMISKSFFVRPNGKIFL